MSLSFNYIEKDVPDNLEKSQLYLFLNSGLSDCFYYCSSVKKPVKIFKDGKLVEQPKIKPKPKTKHSFLCMDGGLVYLHPDAYSMFLQKYAHDIATMLRSWPYGAYILPKFFLVEMNGHDAKKDFTRLWFEFDFENLIPGPLEAINNEFANPRGLVGTLCGHIIDVVRCAFPDIGKKMHISVIADMCNGAIITKTDKSTNTRIYKNGIHLHVPEVFVSIADLKRMRNVVVDYLERVMPLANFSIFDWENPVQGASWENALDESSMCANKGLRLPGSFKCERCPQCDTYKGMKIHCGMCADKHYVCIKRFYYPEVWFYKTLSPNETAINNTQFPSVHKSYSEGQLLTHRLGISMDLLTFGLVYLTSLRCNGNVICDRERMQEKPNTIRNTATSGFCIDRLPGSKRTRVSKGVKRKTPDQTAEVCVASTDEYVPQIMSDFLGPLSDCNRPSDPDLMDAVNTYIQDISAAVFDQGISSFQTMVPAKPPSDEPMTVIYRLRLLQAQRTFVTKEVISRKPYRNIAINSIKCGMIVLPSYIKDMIISNIPCSGRNCSMVKQMERTNVFTTLYLSPIKNEASKYCPHKQDFHSSNNIYFQVIFPAMMSRVKASDDEPFRPSIDYNENLHWVADMFNQMRHHPENMGLPCWFIGVRCFSTHCRKKSIFHMLPWSHLLHLVEHFFRGMLLESLYKYDPKANLYEKK